MSETNEMIPANAKSTLNGATGGGAIAATLDRTSQHGQPRFGSNGTTGANSVGVDVVVATRQWGQALSVGALELLPAIAVDTAESRSNMQQHRHGPIRVAAMSVTKIAARAMGASISTTPLYADEFSEIQGNSAHGWLDTLSGPGKSLGTGIVTLPVAAHSTPRAKVVWKPTHFIDTSLCPSVVWNTRPFS